MASHLSSDNLHKSHRAEIDGVLDLSYFSASRSGDVETTKAAERSKVLRHILDNQQYSCRRSPRLLTNPGAMWTFERLVERELGEYNAFFCGVEKSWSVLEFSLRHMPGLRKVYFEAEAGPGEPLSGFITSKAAIVWSPIAVFIQRATRIREQTINAFKKQVYRKGIDQRLKFNLKCVSGCWIDLFGPLGRPQNAMMLRNLPRFFRVSSQVPVAVTFLYGRDELLGEEANSPLETRANMIRTELNYFRRGSFRISDYWWYKGLNSTRMATVCGIWTQRPKTPGRRKPHYPYMR